MCPGERLKAVHRKLEMWGSMRRYGVPMRLINRDGMMMGLLLVGRVGVLLEDIEDYWTEERWLSIVDKVGEFDGGGGSELR